jgi:hypothetical protein
MNPIPARHVLAVKGFDLLHITPASVRSTPGL